MSTMTNVTSREAPSKGRRARNPRGQGERLRDDLIAAAVQLMAATGDPEDVSIRAVAKAAGVTPTAAYRHFEDRDELIVAACSSNFERFSEFLVTYFGPIEDPFGRLAAAGEGYLAFALEDPGRYRVLFSNPVTKSISPERWPAALAGDAAFEQLVQLVQDCIDAGAKPLRDDARYLAFQIWTWIHGIVDLRITHPRMEFPDAEEMFADVPRALRLDAAG
jgi:AcrR family transcriptional regulator